MGIVTQVGGWLRRRLCALVAIGLAPAGGGCRTTAPDGVPVDEGADAPVPLQTGMHRLNSAEYNATVHDVLGTKLQPANTSWRGGEIAGFDNIASQLGIDEAQYDRYFRAARELATDVASTGELRQRLVRCELADSACVETSIGDAGLRLFRRPLESEELQSYRRVYAAALSRGESEADAWRLTLEALLSSVQFLYRIELDPEPGANEAHPLSGYELASRLSYFLWSSAPDDALLQAAADGSLLRADGLAAAVDRMLDESAQLPVEETKSWRFVANFGGQWLGARQVPSHASPSWSAREAWAAGAEMLYYFNDFLHSGRSWLEFPTADFNYVNGELPFLYGMRVPDIFGDPPPDDWTSIERFRRVEYAGDRRAGFFGLAGFLALTSFEQRTSPSKRGKWIAANLLCAEPPPPPAKAQATLDADAASPAGGDLRQRLERHRKDPACAACHALFDPYGLALEHFGPIGRYRETYEDGSAIDASAELPATADDVAASTVSGLSELAQRVSEDPRFASCLVTKLMTYGWGRVVTDNDQPLQRELRDAWLAPGETPSLRRLIHVLVSSKAFRFRRGEQ